MLVPGLFLLLLLLVLQRRGNRLGCGALLQSLKQVVLVMLRRLLQTWLDESHHDGLRSLLRSLLRRLHTLLRGLSNPHSLLLLRPLLHGGTLRLDSILLQAAALMQLQH